MGVADTQLKWNWEIMRHKITQGHKKLCGSAFSPRPRTKTEGKYFTSEKELQIL